MTKNQKVIKAGYLITILSILVLIANSILYGFEDALKQVGFNYNYLGTMAFIVSTVCVTVGLTILLIGYFNCADDFGG
jgi:succinate dehydrogenase/fumarate reductase cytochrome b subunit